MYICKKMQKKAELNILNGVRTSGEVSGIQKRFALSSLFELLREHVYINFTIKKKKRTEEQLLKLGLFS